jgi:hypothetical protein
MHPQKPYKIARNLEWKHRFTLRAIRECKKFIYLGAVSDFVVTPSKIIDQVWHEHLLFTKAYRDFCTDVPGFSFDHNPELIPMTIRKIAPSSSGCLSS